VTCRDWFQLTLKEGLTVFRDQEFSGDMGSNTVKRIEDVQSLRGTQFAEDAGPMSVSVFWCTRTLLLYFTVLFTHSSIYTYNQLTLVTASHSSRVVYFHGQFLHRDCLLKGS
jgi:hypothetical protein